MSQILPIITLPTKTLREASNLVILDSLKTSDFQKLCDDMITTMYADDGIGLAAPQIGKNVSLITIGKDAFQDHGDLPFNKKEDLVLINPQFDTYSWQTTLEEERCLSIPGVSGDVTRHKHVTVSALSRSGEKITFRATDYFARVLQHEVDHTHGILFIDRAQKIYKIK